MTSKQLWIASAGAALLAVVAFANALSGGFVWDDALIITRNPSVIGDSVSLRDLLFSDLWRPVYGASSFYRPAPLLLFRLLYLAFGLNPAAFHAVNVALHAATAVLVFWWVWRVLHTDSRRALIVTFVAAALFASHPIHTQAVAWCSGVMDVGATLFSLTTLLLAMPSRSAPGGRPWASAAALLVALAFKEVAVASLAIMALAELLPWQQRPSASVLARRWVPHALAFAAYLVARTLALGGIVTGPGRHPLLVGQLLGDGPRVLLRYLAALVVPAPLAAIHDVGPSTPFLSWQALLAWTLVAVLLGAGIRAARGRRDVALAVATVLLPLAPALLIVAITPRGELHNAYAERYLYLPSVGAVLGVASVLARVPGTLGARLPALAAAVCVAFGLLTLRQNAVWRDEVTLWTDNLQHSPELAIGRLNLASALQGRGDVQGSVRVLDQVHELSAAERVPYLVLQGTNAGLLGDPRRAVTLLTEAAALGPDRGEVFFNLGVALEAVQRPEDARAAYERCLRLLPGHADAHNNLGVLLARTGDLAVARDHFAAAVRARKHDASARQNLAQAERLLAATPPP